MEVMDGATPKGFEEAGVGETPLLEMVLPGVTADWPILAGRDHVQRAQSRKRLRVKTLGLSGRLGAGSVCLKNKPNPV